MGVILPFILSLSSASQSGSAEPPPPPDPEPEPTDLVIGDNYVEYPGIELKLEIGSSSSNTEQYYTPKMVYHEGKTYTSINDIDTIIPFMRASMLIFDDQRGFLYPRVIGPALPYTDTHAVSTTVVEGGRVYSSQEHVHDTPMRVYRSNANYDPAKFDFPFSIGTVLSYANFIKKPSGNWMLWSRGIAYPTTNYYSMHITEASSGFTSWGAQRRITSRPTGQDPLLRHYPFVPWGRQVVNDRIYLGWQARKDDVETGSGWMYKHYLAWTPASGTDSGRVFNNIEGTFSHNTTTDGILTDAISTANFATLIMDADNMHGYTSCVGIGPNNEVLIIHVGTNGVGWFRKYWNGTSWETSEIIIPNLATSTVGTRPFQYPTIFTHDKIWVMVRINDGGNLRMHWFQSTDHGENWTDLGDLLPEISGTFNVLIPNNLLEIPLNKNFPIYFSQADDAYPGGAKLYCKVAAFGQIQPIPDTPVVAATDMNYGSTGLFRYKKTNIVTSGSNITTLTDLFGLRNATGVNNPQLTGGRITTNGTNSRFTIASASGIGSTTGFTFMVVAKRLTGGVSNFLCLSDTSVASRYMEFYILNNGRIGHRITNSYSLLTHGTPQHNDEDLHVFTWVLTGLQLYMYVDGQMQYDVLDNTGGTPVANMLLRGNPPSTITGLTTATIGMRDISTGDMFYSTEWEEMVGYNGVMPEDELQSRIKKLCDDYSIEYNSNYRIPA